MPVRVGRSERGPDRAWQSEPGKETKWFEIAKSSRQAASQRIKGPERVLCTENRVPELIASCVACSVSSVWLKDCSRRLSQDVHKNE